MNIIQAKNNCLQLCYLKTSQSIMSIISGNGDAPREPLSRRMRCLDEIHLCFTETFIADPSRKVHFGAKPEMHVYPLSQEEQQMKKRAYQAILRSVAHRKRTTVRKGLKHNGQAQFPMLNTSQNAVTELPVCVADKEIARYVDVPTKKAKRYHPGVMGKLADSWKKMSMCFTRLVHV